VSRYAVTRGKRLRESKNISYTASNMSLTLYNRSKRGKTDKKGGSDRPPLELVRAPTTILSMSERIQNAHSSDSYFPFVSVSSAASVSPKEALSALLASRRKDKSETVNTMGAAPIVLRDRVMTLKFTDYLPRAAYSTPGMPWKHIEDIKISFTPAQSAYDPRSTVRVMVMDYRSTSDPVRRTVTAPNNIGFDINTSLDYSVHDSDLKLLCLHVELTNSSLDEGRAWGSMEISVKITKSKLCQSFTLNRTIGVLRMPGSLLTSSDVDPNCIDLTTSENDIAALRQLHREGKILDQTQSPVDVGEGESGIAEYAPAPPPKDSLHKIEELDNLAGIGLKGYRTLTTEHIDLTGPDLDAASIRTYVPSIASDTSFDSRSSAGGTRRIRH